MMQNLPCWLPSKGLNTHLKEGLFQFSMGCTYLSSRYLSYLLNATISRFAFISLHFTLKNILFWRHLPNQFVVHLEAAPTVQWVLESGQVLQQLSDGKVNTCSQSHDQSSVTCLHPSKFLKVEADGIDTHKMSEQARKMVVEAPSVTRTDSTSSDSDSIAGQVLGVDQNVMNYCLEGTYERSTFLKGAVSSVAVDDLVALANQVSLYSGCSLHRNQIIISKQLLEEGADTWSIISKNNERALWSSVVPEIMEKFMHISRSADSGLSEQDLEVLRGIAGCGDDLGRDKFNRLWYWLYPVAASLAKDKINNLWACTAPVWIEVLITAEEAENALSSRKLLKKPGTFILRFPTTRNWPHPDAGSLVIPMLALITPFITDFSP